MSISVRLPLLVIGASDKFAGHVVRAVARQGARIRGMARKSEQQADVRGHGADESVVTDFAYLTSLERVFESIEHVIYIAPAVMPNEANIGERSVETAVAAGIKRIVLSSVILFSDRRSSESHRQSAGRGSDSRGGADQCAA